MAPQDIIGWREWISLPRLGIARVKAKIDTGARSSAIHAFDIDYEDNDGVTWVLFKVHPEQRDSHLVVECRAPLHDERWIRSSNGKRQLRPVLRTEFKVGDKSFPLDLTLTSRDEMGFRMLLGREALRKRFVIDPGRSYVTRPAKMERRRKR